MSQVGLVNSGVAGQGAGPVFRVRRDLHARRVAASVPGTAAAQPLRKPGFAWRYILASAFLAAVSVAGVFQGNRSFNAEMYDDNGMLPAAEAFAEGKNYANFDLNINIRKLREFHVARMTETPEVVLLGASHWQEAHNNLIPGVKWYNSHIHREFWEDLLGMAYIWESNGRLPKTMVIALRDNIFAPMASRPDYLWEPGIVNWRKMADQLGIEKEPYLKSLPWHRFREKFSLSMLYNNVARWMNADELPQITTKSHFKSLDVLLPDGSIDWSSDHMNIFTPERTLREATSFADFKIKHPPQIEQRGVDAFEVLIKHLQSKGVTIYFVQPPYNPQFWDRVQGTAYMDGLQPVLDLQKRLATKYNIKTFGGFDPKSVGCVATEYIDSEHGNPKCLQKIFNQFIALYRQAGEL